MSMWRNLRGSAILHLKRVRHQMRIRSAARSEGGEEWTPLFIVSQPRTGSTYLQELLDSIPAVTMTGEVLSVTLPIGIRSSASAATSLGHIQQSLQALPGRIRGAKFLIDQMQLHDVTLDHLKQHFPNAKYLILYRQSILEEIVSFRVARETNQWVGRNGAKYKFTGQVRIAPDDLKKHFDREQEKYAEVLVHDWLRDCAAIVSYEGLVESPQAVFESTICPLLGIPHSVVASSMTKQMSRPMSDGVENFDELEPHLDACTLNLEWEPAEAHANVV